VRRLHPRSRSSGAHQHQRTTRRHMCV
jgi:hypothetical protein